MVRDPEFERKHPRNPRTGEFVGQGSEPWVQRISDQISRLSFPPSDEPGLLERVEYRGGFTHSFIGRGAPTKGYALSPYPGRSEVIETKRLTRQDFKRFREANADLLDQPDHYIGAWRERDEAQGIDRVWLDISVVVKDRAEAERIGRNSNQVAMWDLGAGEEIDLGGTGGID